MLPSLNRTVAVLLGLNLVAASCGPDIFLATSALEIGPDPAQPGDVVVASFRLSLAPTQRHTIIIFIDDTEHLRVTSTSPPADPVLLEMGDAGDLIDSYGEGVHSAYIEVRLPDENRTSRTQTDSFELLAAVP